MKKRIAVGISDFKKLIEQSCYFVDKSLLIKEFVYINADIVLIPRPRRFGKTLNMSMLKYFFEKSSEDNRKLFSGLNIEKEEEIMKMQGKYPVIYITFKDLKDRDFDSFFQKVKAIIAEEFGRHRYILESSVLEEEEKTNFKNIIFGKGTRGEYELSLMNLSRYLYKYYGEKPFIFIDEYDVPIQAGFVNGFYDEIINFMRNLLSGAVKDNNYIEKAMITGILRVAKESIFSGLNNLEVSSLVGYNFSDKFGFKEEEVEELLKYYEIDAHIKEVKEWYNGYVFGNEVIYNPWSILNYTAKPLEGLIPHWVNTSSNDLVNILLAKSGEEVKKDLQVLIDGGEIIKTISDNIIMDDIDKSSDSLWSFLLFTGYLKVTSKTIDEGELVCKLAIPNKEVKSLYKNIIKKWFVQTINKDKYETMLKSLISGDIKVFQKMLRQFVLSSISYFDVGGYEGEKVYHAFVLGLLVSLSDTHEVLSNRESGYGRYDIMIIPKDIERLGIVIEFKKLDIDDTETMEETAEEALKQIKDKEYSRTLIDRGIKNIKELGIVFKGKDVLIKGN